MFTAMRLIALLATVPSANSIPARHEGPAASVYRAQRPAIFRSYPDWWRPLRKRAHALERQTELIVGELLISLKARGLRHSGNGGIRRGATRPPSLSDLGITRRQSGIWQARARALPKSSFNARVAAAGNLLAPT